MADQKRAALSRLTALARANECRQIAKYDTNREHQVILEHIAETWERLADVVQIEQ